MNRKHILCSFILTASFSLLAPIPNGIAQNNSPDPPPQTGGRSGGSRGCDTATPISREAPPALILLIPAQPQAKTSSTHPTLAWFVRDSQPQAMKFRLYEYQDNHEDVQLLLEQSYQSQSGILVWSLPANLPKLGVGKRYLWQVELVCNPNRPSSNLYAEAEFEVVAIQPDLATQLAEATNARDRIQLYSQADLWYDALGLILKQSAPNPEVSLESLLEQGVLSEPELEQLPTRSPYWLERSKQRIGSDE